VREFTVGMAMAAVMVTTPSRFKRDCRNDREPIIRLWIGHSVKIMWTKDIRWLFCGLRECTIIGTAGCGTLRGLTTTVTIKKGNTGLARLALTTILRRKVRSLLTPTWR
jgi:hypothetical protein